MYECNQSADCKSFLIWILDGQSMLCGVVVLPVLELPSSSSRYFTHNNSIVIQVNNW